MKSTPRHRGTSNAPRSGAAALMIGGLVAGTVATAGATVLTNSEASEAVAAVVRADITADQKPSTGETGTPSTAATRAAALADLRSSSLSQIRDQVGADRSEARSAPEDAESVEVVLAANSFSGHTPEVEAAAATEETTAEDTAAEEVTEQAAAQPAAEVAPAQETTTQAVQQRTEPVQQTASRQQERQEPAPTQQSQPAPAQPAAPAPVAGGVVGIAQQYVGYPYALGGTPPSSFDCSSFTWWVYQQAGINIPRTVSGQKAAVTPVSNPQPGDLVFTNNFYHVGIYAGNGMVIEALNPGSGVTYGAPVYGGIWYGRIGG